MYTMKIIVLTALLKSGVQRVNGMQRGEMGHICDMHDTVSGTFSKRCTHSTQRVNVQSLASPREAGEKFWFRQEAAAKLGEARRRRSASRMHRDAREKVE